jgi:hypothetical protein
VLYITEPKPNIDKDWFDYYFESFAVISLITSLPQNVDSQAPPEWNRVVGSLISIIHKI